jgi:hypothetical protein
MFFPGLPQPTLQALCTVEWDRNRIIAYISGNTAVLLAGVDKLLQTIYFDHQLAAIAIDEVTGKLAVCGAGNIWVYKPHFRGRENVKVDFDSMELCITSGMLTPSVVTVDVTNPDHARYHLRKCYHPRMGNQR